MKRSIEQFKNDVATLDLEIHQHFEKNKEPGRALISDGIVNIEEYYHSPFRILWLLKEPYCDKKGGGGGWSLTKNLNDERALGKKKDSQTTWHPIVYVSFGITNGFVRYSHIPRLSQDKNMWLVLRKIAYINLQKLPAQTQTDNATLGNVSLDKIKLVLRQIDTYDPHVVIGGGTLPFLKKELGICEADELESGHFHKDGRLYINTKHPAQRGKRVEYVDKIISRVEQFSTIYSKQHHHQ